MTDPIGCEVVDAHFHLFPPRPGVSSLPCLDGVAEVSAATAIALSDEAGVGRAIVFGHPDVRARDPDHQNRHVLAAAREYPGRLVPFGLLEGDVEGWIARGIKGFKEHCYGFRRLWATPEKAAFAPARTWSAEYRAVEAAGLPLVMHFGPDIVSRVLEIKALAPRLRIMAAHLGWHFEGGARPDARDIEKILSTLEDVDDLYFDISCIRLSEGHLVKMACEVVGSHRLAFGSDYPTDSVNGLTPARLLAEIRAMGLNARDLSNILGRTAQRLLGESSAMKH